MPHPWTEDSHPLEGKSRPGPPYGKRYARKKAIRRRKQRQRDRARGPGCVFWTIAVAVLLAKWRHEH
jgi:hypothetical protein